MSESRISLPLSLGADCHDGIEPGEFGAGCGCDFSKVNAFVRAGSPQQMIEQSPIGIRRVSSS